jgi:prepilin-type N-terminal cleavage/methylation domain-containing protein
MAKLRKNSGFSLTEVLLAVGIIAIGMTFVAGVFPVGIYLTTVATERTVAAIVADEAFAKIELCGVDFSSFSGTGLDDFNDVLPAGVNLDPDEFAYPSDPAINISQKQYFWSALCRRVGTGTVQVTVFISRKANPNLRYFQQGGGQNGFRPEPVRVSVHGASGNNEPQIGGGEEAYINDGYTIVDDATGRIYRVLERYKTPGDIILLDRDWDGSPPGGAPRYVWVVPPPAVAGSPHGRCPCIAVYQRIIEF